MKAEFELSEIQDVAQKIVRKSKSKVLLFYGNMGVGKTTLIKEIAKQLGVADITSSPTFSLVNQYGEGKNKIYHFDFYRIKDETEAYDMGLEDYLYDDAWCFIEWPDKISNLLPIDATIINITVLDNGKRMLVMR